MQIETYSGKYDEEIILLILSIQNNEAKLVYRLRNSRTCLTYVSIISKVVNFGLHYPAET